MRNRFMEEPESSDNLFGDQIESGLDKYSKKNDEISFKPFISVVLFLIIAALAFWLFSQYYFVDKEIMIDVPQKLIIE